MTNLWDINRLAWKNVVRWPPKWIAQPLTAVHDVFQGHGVLQRVYPSWDIFATQHPATLRCELRDGGGDALFHRLEILSGFLGDTLTVLLWVQTSIRCSLANTGKPPE